MKSIILIVAFGACVLSTVSSANIPSSPISPEQEESLKADTTYSARSGWGAPPVSTGAGWGASETFSGPPAIAFALPIAVGLIIVLWIAAYNTLRSPPPKIGFGAGAQGGAANGWGAGNVGWGVAPAAGGWGAGSEVYPAYELAPAGSSPQAAQVAAAVQQTVAATGSRSLNDLTQRVLTSIERQEVQHS